MCICLQLGEEGRTSSVELFEVPDDALRQDSPSRPSFVSRAQKVVEKLPKFWSEKNRKPQVKHQETSLNWIASAHHKHLELKNICPLPEPTAFQNSQKVELFQHMYQHPLLKRASESAAYQNARRVTTGKCVVHPVLLKFQGIKLHALQGFHPYEVLCLRIQSACRAHHIENGGQVSTTPYWLPNVGGSE